MLIYPAIDLLGGKAVRLREGLRSEVTVYDDHPHEVARRFAAAGCRRIHVVDLDGAFSGPTVTIDLAKFGIKLNQKLNDECPDGARVVESRSRIQELGQGPAEHVRFRMRFELHSTSTKNCRRCLSRRVGCTSNGTCCVAEPSVAVLRKKARAAVCAARLSKEATPPSTGTLPSNGGPHRKSCPSSTSCLPCRGPIRHCDLVSVELRLDELLRMRS